MRIFNTLCIEISARCNRKCKFCPVAYNTRPDELMSLQLQGKAYRELASLKYKGRIEFYIYNEPLKEMEHFKLSVKLARKTCPRSCLMVATNGDYIRSSTELQALFDLGLNQVLINCYSRNQYPRAKKWMDSLQGVSQEKSVYHVLSSNSRVGQVLDKSSVDQFGTGIFRLVNRAGNIEPFMKAAEAPLKRMCVKPFRIFNINWKGEALVCCQDYHGRVSYGTLQSSTLVQLWNHPIMNEYRRRLLIKDRSLPLCDKCDCHAGAYPHNVTKPSAPYASYSQIVELYRKAP